MVESWTREGRAVGEALSSKGRRSERPEWTVLCAPAVKYPLPPAQASGHLSTMRTGYQIVEESRGYEVMQIQQVVLFNVDCGMWKFRLC
jgi:hypothetical protein